MHKAVRTRAWTSASLAAAFAFTGIDAWAELMQIARLY